LPRHEIEAPRECSFPTLGAIGRQKGDDRGLHDRLLWELLAGRENFDLLQKLRREVDVYSLPHPEAVVPLKRCLPGKTAHLRRADLRKQVPGEDTWCALA
jgi:hypothetical protein